MNVKFHKNCENTGHLFFRAPIKYILWCYYRRLITSFIPLHEKFLQFDWLRAVVFQLNLKYLHVKITNLLRVVV